MAGGKIVEDQPMYWMLECYRPDHPGRRCIESWPSVPGASSWLTGSRFESSLPQPIMLFWDPEAESAPPKALYKAGIPLMSRGLHRALQGAGVDNLDVYETQIRSHNSKELNQDFLAFNLIGVIAAADLSKCRFDSAGRQPLIAVDFDSVVIDPKAAAGALMFRLAECVSAIVIHNRVKEKLENAQLGLTFVRPEDWVG